MRPWALAGGLAFCLCSASAAAHPCKLRPLDFRPTVEQSKIAALPAEQLQRLQHAGGDRRWIAALEDGERFGFAERLLPVPPERALEVLEDFDNYHTIAPRRIGATRRTAWTADGGSEVYLQLKVMRGALLLWQVLRFSPPHADATGAVRIDGHMLRGNLRSSRAVYWVYSAPNGHSVVRLALRVEPQFQAPRSVLEAELRDAAATALRGLGQRMRAPAVP